MIIELRERRAFERWFTNFTGLSLGASDRSEFGYCIGNADIAWAAWCASHIRSRKAGGK